MWFKNKNLEYIKNDKSYKNSFDFSKKFNPNPEKSYDLLYDIAMMKYNEIYNSIRMLDEKADSMIKYLAPLSGFLGIVFGLIVLKESAGWINIIISISILFILLSIICAVYARSPQEEYILPSIEGLSKIVDGYKEESQIKAKIASIIDNTTIAQILICDQKAKRLNSSFIMFIISLIILLFAFISYILTKIDICYFMNMIS